MMDLDFGLFDEPSGVIPRDGHKRPMILPPPGGWPDGVQPDRSRPYTRASTFAKALDDTAGLAIWRGRHIALAVAKRPDLMAIIGSMNYGSEALDQFIEEALERAKDDTILNPKTGEIDHSLVAANMGTAVHSWTVEHDVPPGTPVPKPIESEVGAYGEALRQHGFTVIESEVFVVDDVHRVAGTFDDLLLVSNPPHCEPGHELSERQVCSIHAWAPLNECESEHPDNVRQLWHCITCARDETIVVQDRWPVRISDKKTAGSPGRLNAVSEMLQLTVYANGRRYNPVTGERSPIHPRLDHDTAHAIHLPLGSGRCDVYDVDLEVGREAVRAAMLARLLRSKASKLLTLRATTMVYDNTEGTYIPDSNH